MINDYASQRLTCSKYCGGSTTLSTDSLMIEGP